MASEHTSTVPASTYTHPAGQRGELFTPLPPGSMTERITLQGFARAGGRRLGRGVRGMMMAMEALTSRILLRPCQPERSRRFYRDTLGLAVFREFGPPEAPGLVFFLGAGFLEVSGQSTEPPGSNLALWIQVRDLEAEHQRLDAAGVHIVRGPRQEPWGLVEMWIEDPDGVPIVLVEVPADHPLRRDQRGSAAPESAPTAAA